MTIEAGVRAVSAARDRMSADVDDDTAWPQQAAGLGDEVRPRREVSVGIG
jgi:hypothetical protein